MILTERTTKDYCKCDGLADRYGRVKTESSAALFAGEGVKLEPLEVKSEPLDCSSCKDPLYTHNTDQVCMTGGKVGQCPVPWLEYCPEPNLLLDKLSRSVKVGHMPSSVHQQSLKGTMAMAGPVITLEYFHQTGQYMQYWFCEYQAEDDAFNSVKKLHGTLCHGVELHVTLALKNRQDLQELRKGLHAETSMVARELSHTVARKVHSIAMDTSEDVLKNVAPSKRSSQCLVCQASYSSPTDLSMHLYLSHNMYPLKDPNASSKRWIKFSKSRTKAGCHDNKMDSIHGNYGNNDGNNDGNNIGFNPEEWIANRPFRNPDVAEFSQYTLDGVIGVKEQNGRIGFVPLDHTYASVGEVVRGMIPNSLLNGPDPMTFHSSMVTKVQQKIHDKEKIMFVPVEHSYCKLEPSLIWCYVCGKKYKSTSVLDDHLPVHFKKKEGKKEDSKRKLKRAPATDFTCKMCSEVYRTKKEFIAHVASHAEEGHECQYCESAFSSADALARHNKVRRCCDQTFRCDALATKHADSHTKCCCEVCGDKFSALQDFIQHLSNEQHTVTKQARHTLMIPEGCERFDLFQLEPRSGDYHCMKCSKTCESDVELYSHMGFHHKAKRAKPEVKISQPAEQQSPMVNPTVLKSSPSKYPSKPLIKDKLPVPKKPVPEEQEHVPKPSPKKKDAFDSMFSSTETCTICKKSLPSKKLLQIHMAAHKSQFLRDLKPEVPVSKKQKVEKKKRTRIESEIECPRCPGMTFTPEGLANHDKAFHEITEEEVTEPVPIPGLPTLPDSQTLKARVGKAKKSAVKLFKCVYCEKRFAQETGMQQHMKAVHNLNHDKPLAVTLAKPDTHVERKASSESLNKIPLETVEKVVDKVQTEIRKFKRTTPKTFHQNLCDGDVTKVNEKQKEGGRGGSVVIKRFSQETGHVERKASSESLDKRPLETVGKEEDEVQPNVRKFKQKTPNTFLQDMCDGNKTSGNVPKVNEKQKESGGSGVIRARKTAAKLFKCRICDIRFGSKRILSFHKQQHAEGKIKAPEKAVSTPPPPPPLHPVSSFIINNVKESIKPASKASVERNSSLLSSTENPVKKRAEEEQEHMSDGLEDISDDEMEGDVSPRKVARKTIMKKLFECDICKEVFMIRADYIDHIKNHVDDEGSPKLDGEVVLEEEADGEVVREVGAETEANVNDIDGEVILDVSDIENIQPNNNSRGSQDEVLSDSDITTTQKPKTEETKTCNICHKKFLAWATICAHIGTHEGATPNDVTVDWQEPFNPLLPCYICREKVHAIGHCYLHYKYHVNQNQGTLQCTVCGMQYEKVGTLHTHMKCHVPNVAFVDNPQISDRTHEICKTCNRVTTPKSRKRHLEIHLEPIAHFCELCLAQFTNQKEYIDHFYKTHYNVSRNDVIKRPGLTENPEHLKCCYCKSLFLSIKSRRNHEYKHKKGIFKLPCSKCPLKFQDEGALKYHLQFGHDGEVYKLYDSDRKHVCGVCSKGFRSYKAKWYHEKVQHQIDNPFQPPQDETENDSATFDVTASAEAGPVSSFPPSTHPVSSFINNFNQVSPMKLNLYSCLQCGNTFRHPSELIIHRQTVHGESAKESSLYSNHSDQSNHNNQSSQSNHGNHEKSPEDLEEGEICEEEDEMSTFHCTMCEVSFKGYSEKWFHDKEVHGQEKKCMACGLDFKSNQHLEDHHCMSVSKPEEVSASLIHYKDRKCHACNKLVPNKLEFTEHIKSHWFRCFSCHYDFCSKKSLRAHHKLQKCYTPDTTYIRSLLDEVQSECLLCDEVMSINRQISQHYLVHTWRENGRYEMFICTICGAPYKLQNQLQEHMRTEAFFLVSKVYPKLKHIPLTGAQITTKHLLNEIKHSSEASEELPSSSNSLLPSPSLLPNPSIISGPMAQSMWQCPFCKMSYKNYKSAWSHIRSYHNSVEGKPLKVDGIVDDHDMNGVEYEEVVTSSPTHQLEYEPSSHFQSASYRNHYESAQNPQRSDATPIERAALFNRQTPRPSLLPTPPRPVHIPVAGGSSQVPNREIYDPLKTGALIAKMLQGSRSDEKKAREAEGKRSREPSEDLDGMPLFIEKKARASDCTAVINQFNASRPALNRPPPRPLLSQQPLQPRLPYNPRGPGSQQFTPPNHHQRPLHLSPSTNFNNNTRNQPKPNSPPHRYPLGGRHPPPQRPPQQRYPHPQRHPGYNQGPPRQQAPIRYLYPPGHPSGDPRYPSGNPRHPSGNPRHLLGAPRPQSVCGHNLQLGGRGLQSGGALRPSGPGNQSFIEDGVHHSRVPLQFPDQRPRLQAPDHRPQFVPPERPSQLFNDLDSPQRQKLMEGIMNPSSALLAERRSAKERLGERARNNSAEHSNIEHSTSENGCKSELSSRPNTAQKPTSHKCSYCQRVFKNYFTVYNHLIRNHLSEVKCSGRQKPISSVVGRCNVWSFELSQ